MRQNLLKCLLGSVVWLGLAVSHAQVESLMLPEGPPPERPEIDKSQTLQGGLDTVVAEPAREPEKTFRFPSSNEASSKEINVFEEAYGEELDRSMPEEVKPRRELTLSKHPSIALSELGDVSGEAAPAGPDVRRATPWSVIIIVGVIVVIVIAVLMVALSRPAKAADTSREEEHL